MPPTPKLNKKRCHELAELGLKQVEIAKLLDVTPASVCYELGNPPPAETREQFTPEALRLLFEEGIMPAGAENVAQVANEAKTFAQGRLAWMQSQKQQAQVNGYWPPSAVLELLQDYTELLRASLNIAKQNEKLIRGFELAAERGAALYDKRCAERLQVTD